MRTKFTLLAILALLFSGCNGNVTGTDVTPPDGSDNNPYKISVSTLKQRALDYGEAFGRTQTRATQVTVKDVLPLSSVLGYSTRSDGDPNAPQLYIINFADNEGFAIMTDDSRFSVAPYGYATSGNVTYPLDNPAFEEYLGELNGSLNGGFDWIDPSPGGPGLGGYIPNTKNLPFNDWGTTDGIGYPWIYPGKQPHPVRLSCKVLDTPNFGQLAPYNLQLPIEGGGGYYPTGCVATAMAIIMAYHRWPQSVTTATGEVKQIDWDKALSGNPANSNIDYLMKDIGVQVHMSYTPTSSSSNIYEAYNAYYDYGFPYPSFEFYDKKQKKYIEKNIDNGQPIHMRGEQTGVGGHAWVVDGYMYLTNNVSSVMDYVNIAPDGSYNLVGQRVTSTGQHQYFHMNWGHDGRNNGFFDFDTLEAAYDPLNKPSDSKFLKERMIIYDIKKQ